MKMKQAEYFAALLRVRQLSKDGEITPDEERELLHEVNKLYKSKVSQEDTNKVIDAVLDGIPIDFAEKHVGIGQPKPKGTRKKTPEEEPGNDSGTRATDAAVSKVEQDIRDVYQRAAKEMQAKLNQVVKENKEKLDQLYADKAAGLITQADIDRWVETQNHRTKQMEEKLDQIAGVMTDANRKALGMINGATLGVFAENATFQNYQLARNTGLGLMFSVYDENAVKRLIKEDPELLPRKVVNGRKDKAWNQRIISNALKQAIIQGESIPTLARRIAAATASSNNDAMVRYARTAMTSAQNAGRQEMLNQAKGMGIKCKKVWLATLDSRTRDAHSKLDGQKVDIDKPFKSDFGDIMYPGDMGSSGSVPANLYNCRCTLTYEYEGFPNDQAEDLRRDNETGELIKNMTYTEWKKAKSPDNPPKPPEPSNLQKKVDEAARRKTLDNLSTETRKAIDDYIEGHGNRFSADQVKEITDAMETTDQTLYRIEDMSWMAENLEIGDTFTFDKPLKGFANDPSGAATVMAEGEDAGLYEGQIVMFQTVGKTDRLDISGMSRNHAEEQESLVGGKFRVVDQYEGDLNGKDVWIVQIEQVRDDAEKKTALQDLKDTINSHEGTWTEKELRETGAKAARALEESRKEKGYYEQQEKVEKANAEEKESFQKYCAASRDFYKTKKDAPDFDEKKRRMEEANREYRASEKVTRDARKELEEREASVF